MNIKNSLMFDKTNFIENKMIQYMYFRLPPKFKDVGILSD